MQIAREHLLGKPKKIGEYEGQPVMELATKGGLHLVVAMKKNGKTETLGTGSHRAIARFIAEKEFPGVKITELEKSEDLPRWLVEKHAPQFVELTERIRALE
jgi:hypothetical protein